MSSFLYVSIFLSIHFAKSLLIYPSSDRFLIRESMFTRTIGTKIPSFIHPKNTLPLARLLANIKSPTCDKSFQKTDIAFLVSTASLFHATTSAAMWSATINASKANNDAAGEKIQSSTKPVKAPIENPPKTLINRTCFLKFKHKTSIAMDFMSSCNAVFIYDLSFKNVLI